MKWQSVFRALIETWMNICVISLVRFVLWLRNYYSPIWRWRLNIVVYLNVKSPPQCPVLIHTECYLLQESFAVSIQNVCVCVERERAKERGGQRFRCVVTFSCRLQSAFTLAHGQRTCVPQSGLYYSCTRSLPLVWVVHDAAFNGAWAYTHIYRGEKKRHLESDPLRAH